MLSIARMTSVSSEPFHGHFVPWGLHHETDTRPHRVRTVIVYMSDVESGGHTIFPLCGAPAKDPKAREVQASIAQGLHSQLGDAATGFNRWEGGRRRRPGPHRFQCTFNTEACAGARRWRSSSSPPCALTVTMANLYPSRQVTFDYRSDHPFNAALSLMCQGSMGVSVAPLRGKAVMFDSLLPDKSPNRDTWHGGCNVAKVSSGGAAPVYDGAPGSSAAHGSPLPP